MSLSTNLIAGLSSGFDWRGMIDQLIAIEHRRVDVVEVQKSEYESKLSAWQSFNTKLLALKTASEGLKDPEDFYLYTANMTSNSSTVEASDLLSVSITSSASQGSYSIKVTQLATAQKLSSASFSSFSDALGSSYEGDILVNGRVVNISDSDGLDDVRDKINNANAGTNPTGVTASIVAYGANDYRLILTSDNTGADGIGLQNASAANLVELFGWKDSASSVKNSITAGAQSDTFASSTQDIKTLLGLSTIQSGTIQIKDGNSVYQDVSINFSTDSLEAIKTKINDASIVGVTASIITDTSGSQTTYRLQIDGSQDFVDSQNILETIGVLHNGVTDVQGTTSANTMTADGVNITASTLLTSIDGYNTFTAGGSPAGDYITISGADHSDNPVNTPFDITATSTVQDLLDAIETAFEANGDDVSVYVTSDGEIEVVDMETGTSYLSVALASTIQDTNSNLDWGAFTALAIVRERELVEGNDAALEIDGVEVTSTDNVVDDVISGVTLNLLKADSEPYTTITLNINRDVDAIMGNINTFVANYNEVAAYISLQQSYDTENESTGGILFGDGTLSSVKSDLTSVLVQQVSGVSNDFSILGIVGINLDNEGQLSIDSDTLRGYLETNFNDVKNLFAANGTTNVGTLEYVTSSRDTQAGEYKVNITTAAIQSTSTSDNGTVAANETLTITEGTKVAEIDLTTSMTLTDIKNAINTELDKVYTESLVGAESLYADEFQTQAIDSATTWDSVYDSGGLSANLVNEDVISFTGTSRSGGSVSGSYTIANIATDTVQGLLSAIESAYGNEVTASINGSGQIVLEDKYSGDSQLSVEFDYTDAHDLDFGSVLTTNSGGQEGRYSMDITATDDGDGHLVLTHNSYGSDHSFNISETGDQLWTGGDQTVDNGVDVAGTINGEAATGSGQVLTGTDGENNVDGLVIKYTGSSTGDDIGRVTLTLGAAELFERALYNITDSIGGYVAFKQDSIQDRVKELDTRIETMEARLDRKMETMINRFVAMELALSRIQNQSNWLSSQLNASWSAWK